MIPASLRPSSNQPAFVATRSRSFVVRLSRTPSVKLAVARRMFSRYAVDAADSSWPSTSFCSSVCVSRAVVVPRKNRFGFATGTTCVWTKPLSRRIWLISSAGATSPHRRTAVLSETVSRFASAWPTVTLLGYAPSSAKMPSVSWMTMAAVTVDLVVELDQPAVHLVEHRDRDGDLVDAVGLDDLVSGLVDRGLVLPSRSATVINVDQVPLALRTCLR